MSCALYNNNGYGCAGCCHFNKSTAITLSGTVVDITIPDQTLSNGQKLCVALCQSIPTGITATTTVSLSLDGTTIPLRTPCGNNVYASQLRSRKVLKICVATDTSTGVVTNAKCLCPSSSGFPIISPAPAAASATSTTEAMSLASFSSKG